LGDNLRTEGDPFDSDLITDADMTDQLIGKLLEVIRIHNGEREITVERMHRVGRQIPNLGRIDLQEDDRMQLNIMQHHDDIT